ncbi:MAG: DUF433 domain-containing protein [Gammaproteobacteria bacterium]
MTVDPNILVGKPIINGTRIAVELIRNRLADGRTMERILDAYPPINRENVRAASAFVTEVFREEHFIAIQKTGR